MNQSTSKSRTIAGRIAERREREMLAPRLTNLVPDLTSLQIEVHEQSATSRSDHKKHVVIRGAPALFVITCGDERCEHGGHDITHEVLRALRCRLAQAEGTHDCNGTTGTAPCMRKITFQVKATYAARQSASTDESKSSF